MAVDVWRNIQGNGNSGFSTLIQTLILSFDCKGVLSLYNGGLKAPGSGPGCVGYTIRRTVDEYRIGDRRAGSFQNEIRIDCYVTYPVIGCNSRVGNGWDIERARSSGSVA